MEPDTYGVIMMNQNYNLMYHGTDILSIFKHLTKSLDVLFVLEDKKPVARVTVSDGDYSKVKSFCDNYGLVIKKSHEKVLKNITWGEGSFDAVMVDALIPSSGDYFVYISKHESLAERAKVADFLGNHEQLGTLLGYPSCCVNHFKKIKDREYAYANDFITPALDNSSFKVSLINILPRHVDVSLISHYPCSFDCVSSIKIAEQHLGVVRNYSPELADHILGILKSPVLFTQKNGVHILLNNRKDGGNMRFQGVLSSIKNTMHDSLMSWGQISANEEGLLQFD